MDKDTLLAIKNEYRDMINMLGHRVKVERLPVAHGEGLLCKWKFNVNAPSYYISSKDDVDPKRTTLGSCMIICIITSDQFSFMNLLQNGLRKTVQNRGLYHICSAVRSLITVKTAMNTPSRTY